MDQWVDMDKSGRQLTGLKRRHRKMSRMSKIARFVKEVRTRNFLFNYSTLFSKIFVKVSGSGSREKDQIVVDQCTIYTWCTPTPTVIALTGACSCAFTD